MKSYAAHLTSTKSFGESQSLTYRPVMRSSAAFPLIHKPGKVTSLYTFMGYWLRKRHIPLVTVLATVRAASGEKIRIDSIEVRTPNSYLLPGSDLVANADEDFVGSLELEIFSAIDMVFPYPAITFGLKGMNGLTFVHTCGRIYNDFDDVQSNSEQAVPETGFDLYGGPAYNSFFAFVNGPIAIEDKKIELEYISDTGATRVTEKTIDFVPPYGLGWVALSDPGETQTSKRCVKIRHDFEGFFPRFVAGNMVGDFEDLSLTHSYYDTSVDTTASALWTNPSQREFFDSVIAIPFDPSCSEIELAIYPAFARAPVNITFDLYDANGCHLRRSDTRIELATGTDHLQYIPLMQMFADYRETLSRGMVRLVFDGKGTTPARMKFGLNFIHEAQDRNLPSNVCFNAHVPNEKILSKPGTFRWCTLFDAENQKVFLHNTSFVRQGFRDAEIQVEVCRQRDQETLAWNRTLAYNGTIELIEPKAEALKAFLGDEVGWVSLSCSSPFVGGFYVTDYRKGVVGADHLY